MEKMNYKRYRFYKLLITLILVAMMSTFVGLGNFIAALIVFAVSIILIMILRKNVKGVLSDERAENIGGKAARMVLTVFALLMAGAGIVLVCLRDISPQYLIIGNILLFLECGMMLFYVILFKYYSNKKK
jgi:uncharacterized membrane protein